jgi:hypothetical protein
MEDQWRPLHPPCCRAARRIASALNGSRAHRMVDGLHGGVRRSACREPSHARARSCIRPSTSGRTKRHKEEVAKPFRAPEWQAHNWGSFHYEHPTGFLQAPSSVIGTDAEVVIPWFTKQLDYELELGVIIGKRGKYVSKEGTLDNVAGYCVFNDISARDIQAREHANKVILLGKSFDTSCPLGPWLTTKDEVGDPQNLKMQLRLNGELRQDANTECAIWSRGGPTSPWSRETSLPRARRPGSSGDRRNPFGSNRATTLKRASNSSGRLSARSPPNRQADVLRTFSAVFCCWRGVDRGTDRVTRGLDLEQRANLCSTGFRDPMRDAALLQPLCSEEPTRSLGCVK